MNTQSPPQNVIPLGAELADVVAVRLRAAADLPVPTLREAGRQSATGNEDPVGAAIQTAVRDMGDTPFARAARALFGLDDPLARLGVRQEAAAGAIPISTRQFRRRGSYQDKVIRAVADSIRNPSSRRVQSRLPRGSLYKLESQVVVRDAAEHDRSFVVDLMDSTLGPFYGGDHRAHAERIFDAHIAGGIDRLGYFSVEQHMFIATLGAQRDAPRIGMVHVVAKRQETVKVSPLIVATEVRGRLRVGSALLNQAQKFARGLHDRAIYCTVAQSNVKAMEFFRRNGFVVAGRSDSHYMPGVTETMLYKLLAPGEAVETFDAPNISVEPLELKHRDQVRALLLEHLAESFLGIDDSWVDSLFAGYERRHRGDVNQKYKLIFVATNRNGTVLGVAGATPKKGEPIKIMPLIATTCPAFSALITDIPFLLKRYGRKLYAHLSPGVDQTIALQRRGWKLDAALPAAFTPPL